MKWELVNKKSKEKNNLLISAFNQGLATLEQGVFLTLKPSALSRETEYRLTFSVGDSKYVIDINTK